MTDSNQSSGVNIGNVQGDLTAGDDIVGRDKITNITNITLQPGQLAEAALRRLAQPYYLRVLVVISAPIPTPTLTPQPPLPSGKAPTGEGESLPALNFQQEWADLRQAVLKSGAPILLIRLQPPTLDALRYICSPQAQAQNIAPHIVHFIGHGSPDGIILEDEFGFARLAPSAEIAAALKDGGVKMCVLNACYSANAPDSPALAPLDKGDVAAAVGHAWPVGDRAAIDFAGALYRELIGGRPAGEAFDRARIAAPGADSAVFAGDRSLAFRLDPVPAHLSAEPQALDGLPPHNVPRASHFVGRAAELAQLARTLADAQMKAATITGIGGIGKSTLAQEAAHRAGWRFPGGMAWLSAREMAGFNLDRASADLLRAMSIPLNPTDDPRNSLVQHLKTRPALIILDNLESIPAPELRRVRGLLDSLAAEWGSKALVTLRPPLPVFEEMPEAWNVPLHAGLDYLSAVKYLRKLVAKNSSNIKSLYDEWAVERVDGHPRMIEVVAGMVQRYGWVRTQELLTTLSGKLVDRMDELYQSSIKLLGDEGRRLLPYLPLFPGGTFTIHLIRAACSDEESEWADEFRKTWQKHNLQERFLSLFKKSSKKPERRGWVDNAVDQLVDSGLITFDPNHERYLIHSTVIDYLQYRYKLISEEAHKANFQLMFYYTLFIHENQSNFGALALEYENIERMLHWIWSDAQIDENAAIIFVNLIIKLERHFNNSDRWKEGEIWLRRGIKVSRMIRYDVFEGYLCYCLGMLREKSGDFEQAKDLYQQSYQIAQRIGDERNQAFALQKIKEIDAAARPPIDALTLHDRAFLELTLGDFAQSRKFLLESLTLTEKLNDQYGRASVLASLGKLAESESDYAEAQRCYRESFTIFEQLDSAMSRFVKQMLTQVEGK